MASITRASLVVMMPLMAIVSACSTPWAETDSLAWVRHAQHRGLAARIAHETEGQITRFALVLHNELDHPLVIPLGPSWDTFGKNDRTGLKGSAVLDCDVDIHLEDSPSTSGMKFLYQISLLPRAGMASQILLPAGSTTEFRLDSADELLEEAVSASKRITEVKVSASFSNTKVKGTIREGAVWQSEAQVWRGRLRAQLRLLEGHSGLAPRESGSSGSSGDTDRENAPQDQQTDDDSASGTPERKKDD